jgi:hypothetical protein
MQGAGLRNIPSSFCMDFLYDFPSIGLWLRNTEFWTRKAPCTKPYCSMPFDPAAAICPYLRRESLLLQQGHPGPTRSPSNTLAWVRKRPQLLQSSCQNDLNSPVTNSPWHTRVIYGHCTEAYSQRRVPERREPFLVSGLKCDFIWPGKIMLAWEAAN